MRVIHSIKNFKITKSTKQDIGFLLSDKKGGYLSFYLPTQTDQKEQNPISHYQGWFVTPKDSKIFKIIENLEIVDASPVTELRNNFWNIERKRAGISENFFLPQAKNSFVYELSKTASVDLILDIREPYDSSEWERYYQISEENEVLLIKYTQKKEGQKEFLVYLAIQTDSLDYSKKENWFLRNYQLDKKRGSSSPGKYIFSALRIKAKKIVFSVSIDKEKAIKKAKDVFLKTEKLKKIAQKENKKIIKKQGIKGTLSALLFYPLSHTSPYFKKLPSSYCSEIQMANICAKDALNKMVVLGEKKDNAQGMFAGLPWFFQFWTRDTAISLKSFFEIDKKQAKQILFKQLDLIDSQGHINGTVDGVGWLFKRVSDFLNKGAFNKKEKEFIKNKLKSTINGLLEHWTEDDYALSLPRQTWMDTLERDGKQVEIQALRLNTYKLAYQLFKDKRYLKLEKQLRKKVQKKFWNGKYLFDELNDPTIRSNVFLVAYIYPELLKKREWVICFENILPELWCEWGGVATVNKRSPFFVESNSGESPQSYHSGDSWFWINNLVAIALYRADKEKFKKYIDKILEANTKEILSQGIVGHHTELSSARELRSEGCWSQAWSSALYLELMDLLKNKIK